MSDAIWIQTSFHTAFKCGGWAYVRRIGGDVYGQAGGERYTSPQRMALGALIAALKDLPPGAIDVTAGGSTVAVEQDGYAVYVPAPGQAPIGPFRISDKGLARLAALLGDPGIALDGRFRDLLYRNPTTDWNFEPLPEAPIAQDPILF